MPRLRHAIADYAMSYDIIIYALFIYEPHYAITPQILMLLMPPYVDIYADSFY